MLLDDLFRFLNTLFIKNDDFGRFHINFKMLLGEERAISEHRKSLSDGF